MLGGQAGFRVGVGSESLETLMRCRRRDPCAPRRLSPAAAFVPTKQKYDPDGLFTGPHLVGSEFWSADGFTPLG
jgi:hypothetical protein